jgi:hypothetical protein
VVAIIALNSKNRRNALERDRLARTYMAGVQRMPIPELQAARAAAEVDADIPPSVKALVLERFDELIMERDNEARRAQAAARKPV